MQRHRNALAIQDGACNPIAIVNSMVAAVAEIRDTKNCDTDTILRDPALRLMTHQLAFLQNIPTGETHEQWASWRAACEEASREHAELHT